MKKNILALLTSLVLISPNQSFAFGLPDFGDLGGGGGGVSPELEKTQSKLADRTNDVLGKFSKALSLFSAALGLEEGLAKHEIKTDCLNEGGKVCTSSEDIERMESQAAAVTEKVKEMQAKGVKLDAASKAKFTEGLFPFGGGMLKGAILGKDIADFAPKIQSAVTANPLSAPDQLAVGLSIIQQIPPMISSFSDASGGIYDYATYNGIEKPEETGPE